MHLQYQWQYLFFEEDSNSFFPKEPHLFSQLDATTHLGCHYSYTHIPMLWNHDLDSQHLNMLWVLLQDFNVWYFAKHYKEGGIHPIILFFWIAKYWSFVKVPRFVGISSDKSLKLTRKTMMLVQLDKLLGILPLSVLFCNCKNWILCKRPSSRGISLWKLLFWRVRFLKKLKFPIYGEMEPTNFRYCNNTVTLWCQATTSYPFSLAKVDAVIPRVQSAKKVMNDLGFELKQCWPVCLIIPTNHRGY